eukprot:GFYU01006367.1.p2 GENE.GFYU01006367.1~~GFYU01006367.1.p2  ORF type:complete len:226 (-),score=61.63 GFYU01006367.1:176-853(-)
MGSGSSAPQTLPDVSTPVVEWDEYQSILNQDIGASGEWKVTADQSEWKNDFKMTVRQREDPDGNKNNIMRGDASFKGIKPEHLLDFFTNPKNLEGIKEWVDVETLPDGDEIKFYSVKMPLMKLRENVLKYKIDKREDGSIFLSIRSWVHDKYPLKTSTIRVKYKNMAHFRMSSTDPTVCELTEFIQMDLGGKFPAKTLNGALGKETIKTNKKMMDLFKKEGKFQA